MLMLKMISALSKKVLSSFLCCQLAYVRKDLKPIRTIDNVVWPHGRKYLFNVVFSGSLCMQTKFQTSLTLNNQKTLLKEKQLTWAIRNLYFNIV